MTEIRICDEYNRLICRHPRSYRDFPLYITDDSHMPPEHLYYKEVNAHDGAYYRRWASVYGESMVTLIDRILRSSKHEEQATTAVPVYSIPVKMFLTGWFRRLLRNA